MPLSNDEIRKAIWSGAVRFDPEPAWEHLDLRGRGLPDVASIPLRLGKTLWVLPDGVKLPAWDPREERTTEWWQRNGRKIVLEEGQSYLLQPGTMALGETLENIHFPIRRGWEWDHKGQKKRISNFMGIIDGRTMHGARFGLLVHCTAPNIWTGSSHRPAVELIAAGCIPIHLVCGYAYFQLKLERVYGKIIRVPSRTNGQVSPAGDHRDRRRQGLHPDAVMAYSDMTGSRPAASVTNLADARGDRRRQRR